MLSSTCMQFPTMLVQECKTESTLSTFGVIANFAVQFKVQFKF